MAKTIDVVRTLCATAVVSLLAQCVLAATPVVYWDSDFKTDTKIGTNNDTYKLVVNGNTVANDTTGSSITIADTERKGVYINWNTTTDAATILVKYSGLVTTDKTYPMGFVGFSNGNKQNIDGLAIHDSSGELKAYWNDIYFYSSGTPKITMDGSVAKFALKYSSAGTHSRSNQSGAWDTLYSSSKIMGGGTYALNGAVVGGSRALSSNNMNLQVATGMQITGIAIFNSVLSDADIAAYEFPSEKRLADDLLWLPIGDSITEGEQYMGHPDQGDVNTRGGYRYQLWREMEEEYGQSTISVGYRTGHSGTVEDPDPATCHWAWHAAQYGGAIMYDRDGSHGAAGLNVESTLEVAGYPDVITVLIGVNDCSFGGANVDKVFETWVNMITKLSALRPKSTICVSTLLPASGTRPYIPSFNTLVRNAATANEAPFNCANVVFADMNQEAFNGTFTAGYFKSTDGLHPNETGAKILGAAFSKYLKDVVVDRATHAADIVSVDNGTAGYVTVRFNKALKSVTSATLTITGTNVAGESVTITLENGTIDTTNKRLLKFATSDALCGGTYTATITNLAGSDGNGLALPASLSITDSKFVEILGTGAASNVPASLRTGFVKHGTLAMSNGTVSEAGIGSGDNFAGNGPDNQFTTDNALPEYVKRVAYYMELKRPGQPAQFVWASMDASTGFGSRSINVGIPTSTSSNIKALVNNLQVYGNRGNFTNSTVTDGVSSDQGIVEFTPWSWTAADQSGFPQDFSAGKFGWNDTLGTSTLKGCMQIAKVLRTTDIDKYTNLGAEMLFAYNNFNSANATDIAIGSFASHRNNQGRPGGTADCAVVYDWTDFITLTGFTKFAANAYEVKTLEIWTEKGEAPSDLYIASGETVTTSASDPLTLPVRGSGRLVLENYLPTDSNILASLQNSATWTGTVEIKNLNYTDNSGIIYFQNYANANSTVALNGVTATMFSGAFGHSDQAFGTLEIMEGGWTTGAAGYTVSPLYNCNLKGSGTITINHSTKSGIVNFCGDHSGFSGAINFATDADKGVVLAPAGTGRTTSGVSARQILVLSGTNVRIAGTQNGTVKIAALTNPTYFDVRKYGNDETIVELMGIDGNNAYPINGTIKNSPKVVLAGNVTFSNGFSNSSLTWSEVSGSGNFTVSKGSDGIQSYVISTIKGYTGAITAKSNTTLTIGSVVTTLDEVPTTATSIVNFGTDCDAAKVLIDNLTICLADGTDVTDQVVITKSATGISIERKMVTIMIPAAPTGATVAVTVEGETVEVVDGSIEATPGAEVVVTYSAAEGYIMTPVVTTFAAGDETTIQVPDESAIVKAVAKVDTDEGVYYAKTLQAAINYAYDGETVTLLSDTTETVSNGKKITLHLNAGATLTGKDWYTVYNYGTLTIEGEGTIKGVATSSNKIIALYNSNTMYITGGIIEAKDYDIYENQAVATVVTGGQFNLTPGPWLTNGYTATVTSDKKYFVVETISDVARIGETSYATLQAALDEVVEGQMIELVSPTSETTTFNRNFIVVIKNSCYNYGNVTGVEAIYERLAGQYTQAANYVILSKSMEDLVDYVTTNDSKYTGGHGCFWVYNDWTLTKNVRIPARGGATQSIFTVNDEFVLDLNGFTLDQAPIVDKNGKSSGHGGYPTIVADRGKKVTIKDSSADQTGTLCGWGWAINIYDDPKTCVTLESGTVTSHGGQHPKSATTEAYSTYRGRVIRIMGGKFVMNGGKITLDHLEEGHQIFGIITADTAVASTPMIEINGGYIECAKPEQLWDPKGDNPNCLIGGSKGPDSEVEITGGSFSIVPPKTYFAEGLDAVVDENGHFHIQEVIHEGEKVTIAVSGDGEKLAPAVPEEGSVEIISPDETKVYVIDIAKQEAPAALYKVVTKDADGEVVSTSNIGVVKVQEAVSVKNTIAVAVPFTGATVANLLNTALLNEGDTLTAYLHTGYETWTLTEGKWVGLSMTRAGGETSNGLPDSTSLVRGQAVWVTTAGQVVVLGTYDDSTEIATADEAVNLLANPTMEDYEVPISAVDTEVFNVGDLSEVYKVVTDSQTQAPVWQCTESVTEIKHGVPMTKPVVTRKAPSIKVGKGYWLRKAKESK